MTDAWENQVRRKKFNIKLNKKTDFMNVIYAARVCLIDYFTRKIRVNWCKKDSGLVVRHVFRNKVEKRNKILPSAMCSWRASFS